MDLETLKLQHPDLVLELLKQGAQTERDRVLAHLDMGAEAGAIAYALGCIRSGEALTTAHQRAYVSASINRADQSARQAEGAAVDAIVSGGEIDASNTGAEPDVGDQIVATFDRTAAKRETRAGGAR